jgi:hypothetical protein
MACPIAAGAAALFLEKYPGISPEQVYSSFKSLSNQSGLTNLPNYTWGYGKLDIYSAMKGVRDDIIVDGNMSDGKYITIGEFTSGRNGFGDKDKLGAIKFYSDGENIFIGITGEASGDNNIILFMDFSGVKGRDSNTLGGGNSGTFVNSVFSYMVNVKMDFDVDFALAFSGGNSTNYEFFMDAIKYGDSNKCAKIGKLNRMGANSNYYIGSLFGGVGFMTVAYDSSFGLNQNKGVEFKIPVSAFAGVDTSQTLRLFAVITSMTGNVSKVCISGDPGSDNLGDGADFSSIPGQDFFTEPIKISNETVLGINSINEVPKVYSLYQNYPNPFNPTTIIKYSIPKQNRVELKVFDLLGKEVATLVNEEKPAGTYNYQLSIDNYKLSSGVYFYRMRAGNFIASKKLILIR